MNRDAEADALQTLFFSDAQFEERAVRRCKVNYLAFLSMRGATIQADLDRLRCVLVAHGADEVERDICRLLRSRNWRNHGMACVSVLMGHSSAATLDALWETLLGGSWGSPQLAATAAIADVNFRRNSLAAVESDATYYKSVVALESLLIDAFGVSSITPSAIAVVAAAKGMDRDDSGRLALGWKESAMADLHPTRQP